MRERLTISLALCLVGLSASAAAVERQWHLGAGLGAGTFKGSSGLAPGAGAYAAYGISDVFDARLELTAITYDFTEPPAPVDRTQVYSALIGLSYKVDVIEWVPYMGLLVGYTRFSGGPKPEQRSKNDLGFDAHVGLDYLWTRSVGFGTKLGYQGFLGNPPDSLADTPSFVFMVRTEYRWGW
jgi:hypothetical protein